VKLTQIAKINGIINLEEVYLIIDQTKETMQMYALFLVLNEVDYLDTILSKFVEVGVKGATILDSQGMARAIADYNIPIFSSFRALFDGARPYNKTIFTVIDNEELLQKIVSVVQEIAHDAKKPCFGFMFTVPVSKVISLGSEYKTA